MYSLLEVYLPEATQGEETDASSILQKEWGNLVNNSQGIRNDLQGQ
jgi:hypothetical protein